MDSLEDKLNYITKNWKHFIQTTKKKKKKKKQGDSQQSGCGDSMCHLRFLTDSHATPQFLFFLFIRTIDFRRVLVDPTLFLASKYRT